MLELLFENIKVYGRYVRTNKLDGLEYWNRIKKFIQRPEQSVGLEEINKIISSNGWCINVKINSSSNSNIEEIYNYVHGDNENQLKIFGEEGDKEAKSLDHDIWSQYHFFLQLIRIPKNNPSIDLLRLLQIAYNLGQLSVCLGSKSTIINSQAQEYFKSNNLDRLDSYIKINDKQKEEFENKLSITDFIANVNSYILEQMNLVQTGGGELEPFYSENVEELTKANTDYRRVIYTGKNQQFVLMSIPPKDFIKMEVHKNHDQFMRIEEGEGEAKIGITTYKLGSDSAFIIPAGVQHKITNTSDSKFLKLYTIYSPPEHPDKLVQKSNPDKLNSINLEDRVIIETDSEELVSPKVIKEELKKIQLNFNQDLIGGNTITNKKIDYKNKYNDYKNKYISLKNFISKYN
jgi:mannose-6-phosphate isomerase-like protein (cupin superfamily)